MGGTASKANKITPLSAEGNSKLFQQQIAHAAQRKDEAHMRRIFNRHAKKDKLSATALIEALKDVSAPVLAAASSEGTLNTADYVFRRADANLSGDVDFSE